MKTITANNHTIIVIEVHESAKSFKINNSFKLDGSNQTSVLAYNRLGIRSLNLTCLPEGFKYSIIGTITKQGEYSFIPSDDLVPSIGFEPQSVQIQIKNAQARFINLLSKNGIYLNNPMGEKPEESDFKKYPLPICFESGEERREFYRRSLSIVEDLDKWEEYQAATVKPGNKLLILKAEKA